MNVQTEEKKMLIESMKKLVAHVSNNPQRQEEIFDALSQADLNKIIQNLQDDNEYLRRISSLLLCELFYQNPRTKASAVKLLGINPAWGRICVGGFSESIKKYPSTLKKCIELMQSSPSADEENKMCWIINLERKTLKIQALEYKKYSSFTFIDPLKNLFGFTIKCPEKWAEQKITEKLKTETSKEVYPLTDSVRQKKKPESMMISTQPSSEFYKNFIESRNKSKQSKRNSGSSNYMNMSLTLNDKVGHLESPLRFTQPLKAQMIPSKDSYKKQDLNRSLEVRKPNTTQVISQSPKNSPIENKLEAAFHNIISSRKVNQNSKTYTRDKQKDIQTDRKIEYKQTRPSSGAGRYQILDQEKFHKRVKEILKK